jgi:uncharacterized protein with ACT and thioredoxin-like domain
MQRCRIPDSCAAPVLGSAEGAEAYRAGTGLHNTSILLLMINLMRAYIAAL